MGKDQFGFKRRKQLNTALKKAKASNKQFQSLFGAAGSNKKKKRKK